MRTPVVAAAILLAAPAIAQVGGERVEDPYEAARRALLGSSENPVDASSEGAADDQAGLGNDRFEREEGLDTPAAAAPVPPPKPEPASRPRVTAADAYAREREKAQLDYWQERARLAREYDREARTGNAERAAAIYREKRRALEAELDARTLELERRYGRDGG